MVGMKGKPFEIFQSGRAIEIEQLIFESFCKSCIKGVIKSSIIPTSVRSVFCEGSHISIDVVIVKHFEVFESPFGGLFDVNLPE